MFWVVFFIVLAVVVVLVGVVVNVNRLRFDRRTTREMGALSAVSPSHLPLPAVVSLPPPVERYRQLAVGERTPIRTLKMRHAGTFWTSPTAKPTSIRGLQFFTADPPGFVWTGRIRMAPGVWIDARDMFAAGEGSMRVLLDDTVPLVDAKGAAIDQGAALRILAEMPWFPTALFDSRYVRWSPIDVDHAKATLRLGRQQVSCVFEFGPEGLPVRSSAERPRETGEMRPWGGTYKDYRIAAGMRVPFEVEVTWQLESGPYTYAHWLIDSFEYDRL